MQVKKIHKRYNLQFQQYQVISCHNKANKPKKKQSSISQVKIAFNFSSVIVLLPVEKNEVL